MITSSRAASGRYYKTLKDTPVPPIVQKLCTRIPSNQEVEIHAWLSAAPMWRETSGDLAPLRQIANQLSVLNKKYEHSIGIPRADFQRDKTGQIMMQMDQLAMADPELWYDLLVAFLQSAGALVCYDGQYFWDNDHSEGESGTQSNLLTDSDVASFSVVSETAPTADEMADAIFDGITYMLNYVDDRGRYMNRGAKKFTVVAAANQVGAAAQLAASKEKLDTGSGVRDNPLAGVYEVDVEIVPELSAYTKDFIINRTDAYVNPFIQQPEEGAQSFDVLAEGSEYATEHDEYLFAARNRGAVAGGFWQYSAFCTLDTAE